MKGLFLVTVTDSRTHKDLLPPTEVIKEVGDGTGYNLSVIKDLIRLNTEKDVKEKAFYTPSLKKVYEAGRVLVEVEFIEVLKGSK